VLAENNGSGALTARAVSELTTVGPADVHILGGPAVVTPTMAAQAAAIPSNPTVDRWDGVNSYDTAIKVADASVTGGWLKWDGFALANGQAFPDALTAAALQGNAGSVLLLTPSVPPAAGLYPGVATKLSEKKSLIFGLTYLGGLTVLPQSVRNEVMTALH
jgi:hypothetical protein